MRDEDKTISLKIFHTTTFIDVLLKMYQTSKYSHCREKWAFNRKLLSKPEVEFNKLFKINKLLNLIITACA